MSTTQPPQPPGQKQSLAQSLAPRQTQRHPLNPAQPTPAPTHITSRANPWFKQLRLLATRPNAYREFSQLWLEGEHLCQAAQAAGLAPLYVVLREASASAMPRALIPASATTVILADSLWQQLSSLESAAPLAWVVAMPPTGAAPTPNAGLNTVVLDRLQDAGNVGSVLRCAAAFGFEQVLALSGTASLWSPKVLRAAMGAHFSLRLIENLAVEQVLALKLPLIATSSHAAQVLHQAQLPSPCAWVFGNEGAGVSPVLATHAHTQVRIAQPGGQESLNVAAAAAICLHASASATTGGNIKHLPE